MMNPNQWKWLLLAGAVAIALLFLHTLARAFFWMAVENKNSKLVSTIGRIDPFVRNSRNAIGATPLHRAIEMKDEGLVRAMIDIGCDVNADAQREGRVLGWAVMYTGPEIQRMLLEAGADPERPSDIAPAYRTAGGAIHLAAASGYADLVELMIDRGADVNLRSRQGNTPLIESVVTQVTPAADRRLTVLLLLKKGADPSLRDDEGMTALDYAVQAWESRSPTSEVPDDGVIEILKAHVKKSRNRVTDG